MSLIPIIPVADNSSHVGDRFLREPEVANLIGVSKMTLRRWEAEDRFPKRYKIGPNSIAWKESEIAQWVANRERANSGPSTTEAQ